MFLLIEPVMELTNERDVDVDPRLGVSDDSRTYRYVMCHFATS